ncbi:RNA polymerase sigma-70 factor [Paenibacillus piri]|uniref:RNA polymerase sigma-70 factor n=1 Tax=Paenibacillus piri TaxID=2547395 RepID=A0A4R5KTQ5_9BACL|nr:RNA polymerase sigma-70 factor [Paenibacillus piri]TDF98287.1 RNA polymerase sigma-70 factor [Paenibacillus piri]
MELETMYTEYKPLLISIAYRMLGSLSDAEDMVQDVFVSMQRVQTETVDNVKAYLVKMTTNRCLNELSSSHKRREVYTGPWLPEPDIRENGDNPEERIVLEESVSYALLVLMQQFAPLERAVFLLKEVLGYSYKEIAATVDKSEANCRKIYSRVLPKINPQTPPPAEPGNKETVVRSFMQASRTGDFAPFIQLLTDEAVLTSDGGGKRRAAIFPIFGRERIRAFLEGLHKKAAMEDELRPVDINGEPGLLLYRDGHLHKAVCFGNDPRQPGIQAVYFILNPDKLTRAPQA